MFPVQFGLPGRRMFGAFHEGSPGRTQSLGVLLCNPFGQEAIRTHRLFRVLAERLASAGIHTLRFDYFATGDSAGDDDEGDLDGWRSDVSTAHEQLLQLAPVRRVTWMGARLGAVNAIRAAAHDAGLAGGLKPDLVLWDPIVDGAAYTQMLREKHVEAVEVSFGLPQPAHWRQLREDPDSFRDQAIGVAIPPLLREQLSMLGRIASNVDGFRNSQLDLPMAAKTIVISDAADASVAQWRTRQQNRGAVVIHQPLPSALEWTSDDSLNAALVPFDAVKQLILAIDR